MKLVAKKIVSNAEIKIKVEQILGREVNFFRCHIDPHIGPMPKQAHQMGFKPGQTQGRAFLSSIGVVVFLVDGTEHFVPYANCQAIKLLNDLDEVQSERQEKAIEKSA